MAVRYLKLGGLDRLGLVEAAFKIIDASVDTIVNEQDESPAEAIASQAVANSTFLNTN